MKALIAGLLLLRTAVAFLVPSGVEGAQVPDPQDSVIIESKYVFPGKGACQSALLKIRVWITNKDSLANVSLPLEERSISGTAYAVISRPPNCSAARTSANVFDFLYPPAPSGTKRLPTLTIPTGGKYHSDSPDTILWTGTEDPTDDDTKLPPNLTRTPLLDIKFDSITGMGQFQLDSSRVLAVTLTFVKTNGVAFTPNFAKGIITVPLKGDINLDGVLTAGDAVEMLNCVFCASCPPPPQGRNFCDVNCDGMGTAADVVIELLAIYLGDPFPC